MKPSDAEQLAALWTKAQPLVYSFVRTLVVDRTHVDDLVQRTAVACVRKFSSYQPDRSFNSWAIGIARYEVLAWRRSQAKDVLQFDDDLVARISAGYERVSDQADSLRDALAACLEEQDGPGREAIRLFYGQDLKADKVAAQMDLTPGAVRTLLYRTRNALRKCILKRLAAGGDQ